MRTSLFPTLMPQSASRIILARSRPPSLIAVRPAAPLFTVPVVRFFPVVALLLPPVSCAHLNATEVTVSASPDVTDAGASVSVTGHLIPQIDIGLSAFGGIVSSSVFLNLDASLDLSVAADNNDDAQACVDASTELAVNIGAQAAFFDLFKASTSDTLFDKNFPLLQVR